MFNKVKARLLLGLGSLAVTGFMVMIGYAIGAQSITKQTQAQIQTETKKLVVKEKKQLESSQLSDNLVKAFITQYYTKTKLGENNHRIKPYMTDSAYSEEQAHQHEAISQVYKDYMIDYQFKDAQIFIDHVTNEALVEVTYQVTYVSDMSANQQTSTLTDTKTVKLSYSKISGKLLVNQLTTWNGKLEDLKEEKADSHSAIPEIPQSTIRDNH